MQFETQAEMATASESGWPSIGEFYSHKDVFITGATGFLGKCLVEKLLRSIPDIGRLIVLVRPKKAKSVQDRVTDMLGSKVFENLHNEQPAVFEKLLPVAGDIMEPGLGLSESDMQLLIDNVAVVFHLAATIRFDAPLRESLTMNVVGVKEVTKICRKMKKLESFVHVSTAYANCHRTNAIEEVVYPPQVHPDKILGLLDWMSEEQLDVLTPTLLAGRPNTYTFTKAMAEYILLQEAKGLPLAIYRPSIVGGSYREPFPGWVDSLHGPAALFVAVGKGLLRIIRGKPDGIADIVPVDLVNNMLISIGWFTGINHTSQPIVYNFTSGSKNPVNWIQLREYVVRAYTNNPFDQVFRRPWIMPCRPPSMWPYYHFFMHLVPGFFADLLLQLIGKKPRMVRLYQKIEKAVKQLDYFTQNDWNWSHRNSDKLLSLLSEHDREVYDFDICKLQWDKYIDHFCMGTKRYLLNEDLTNLPVARRQITRLRNIRYTFNLLVFLLASRVLYLRSTIARELWDTLLGFCLRWLAKVGIPLLHRTI